jgi:hypothetical protein
MKSIAIYTSPETGKTARTYWNVETEEFIVKLIGNPNATYFTNDKDDALATMKAEADFVPRNLSTDTDRCVRQLEDARERDEARGADDAAERIYGSAQQDDGDKREFSTYEDFCLHSDEALEPNGQPS